jgi:DNA-binding NtrC family response regulator
MDVFATAWAALFDLPCAPHTLEVPLWSGMRVQLQRTTTETPPTPHTVMAAPLKAVEGDLIRRAMQQARGNVAQAARSLGISRATLYRKISPPKKSAK